MRRDLCSYAVTGAVSNGGLGYSVDEAISQLVGSTGILVIP